MPDSHDSMRNGLPTEVGQLNYPMHPVEEMQKYVSETVFFCCLGLITADLERGEVQRSQDKGINCSVWTCSRNEISS